MKALFLVLGFFLTFPAFADVSGKWIGWGEWTYEGQGTDCKTMLIRYQETETEFKRLGGTFDCGIVVLHSDPLSWERRGNDLYLSGVKAGVLYPNGFETSEPYNDEGTMVHTKFVREGNHADYEERWVSKDGSEIYLITGRLFFSSGR
jgi:hypothetical protein